MADPLKTLNVAIVGGGPGCKAIMDMIFAEKLSGLRMKVIGVADLNPEAVGYCYAREKGIYTTNDYRNLYKLKGLNLIIELTGLDEVADEISQTKPDQVRLMDHVVAHVFWDIFQIEEERIAERRQVEDALRRSEERLAGIVASMTDHMSMIDNQYNIVWANEMAKTLFGPDLVGKKCYEVYHRRDNPCESCLVEKCFEDGKVHEHETEVIGAGGRHMTFWCTASVAERDKEGRPKTVIEISRDITERKLAREALERAYDELEMRVGERTAELAKANNELQREIEGRKLADKALRSERDKLRGILLAIGDGVNIINQDYIIEFQNDVLKKRFGNRVGEKCYVAYTGFKRPCRFCHLGETIKTGKTRRVELVGTDSRNYESTISSFTDVDGQVKIIELVRDVTERKHMEVERERLQAQLQNVQKLEAIGTLAGGIAHDFNNLLMGIQGSTSLMLLDIDSSHTHYERLKNIEKQVQNGVKLTQQLLGYARKGRYEVKPINLNQSVKATAEAFGRTRKEIIIHQELAEDLLAIKADQGQIEQVLWNLYVNAADAMPGGGKLVLKTRNVTHRDMKGKLYNPRTGKYVLLTVTDTGIGMDKKTLGRIFDPFFTTKEMGRGTGLGLASVYGIIKGHGGYIDVESKKGQGTTFNIYLPGSEKRAREIAKTRVRLIKGSGTVLLVDDEEVIREIGKELLEAMGYRVLTARDGEEAIEIYSNNRDDVNLVLLDMIMPQMGGGKTYDRLKEINPKVRVLLSSGYSIDSEASQILKRGCNGFIQKPFNISELSRKISEILKE